MITSVCLTNMELWPAMEQSTERVDQPGPTKEKHSEKNEFSHTIDLEKMVVCWFI